MSIRVWMVLGTMLALAGVPGYAKSKSACPCEVAKQAAAYLTDIRQGAMDAQDQADQISAYLRSSATPDWDALGAELSYLEDNVRGIRQNLLRFERAEPTLTAGQSADLERLKGGLATLTIFLNNTYQLLAERPPATALPKFEANAAAMRLRGRIIAEAAKDLRSKLAV